MNDFFKTKVGFVIGLLAAVFAFKPLIDSNADLGFLIFNFNLTIEHAYIFLTAFLGLAVYFISLQFASSKHFKLIDSLSDACYTIALATPPVYIFLGVLVKVTIVLEKHVDQMPPIVSSIFVSILTGIFANFLFDALKRSIKFKFSEAEREQERTINIDLLSRAQELLNLGIYDMSVLESTKIVESVLRRLLETRGVEINSVNMMELINLSKKHKLLSEGDIKVFHEIRRTRNESVHTFDAVDKNSAERVLNLSRELLAKLDCVGASSSYEWLELHRDEVIRIFKNNEVKKAPLALKMLKDAWINRDGAVWLELSEFFEVLLVHNPDMLVTIFGSDDELLDSWLEAIEGQIFTDFLGGNIERLESLRIQAISKLSSYVKQCESQHKATLVSKILVAVEQSKVRAID
ncbi:TPA: HEPN domain-containing protein [Vibrio vulnificus]|nr:HEPN domain-containing protein [Vibrio vulnificus]